MRRIHRTVRRWLLLIAALSAPLALLPERFAHALVEAVLSNSGERIATIAAMTNALTLTP